MEILVLDCSSKFFVPEFSSQMFSDIANMAMKVPFQKNVDLQRKLSFLCKEVVIMVFEMGNIAFLHYYFSPGPSS